MIIIIIILETEYSKFFPITLYIFIFSISLPNGINTDFSSLNNIG